LKHQFEILIFALLFSGNILVLQGQRRKGLEDISRSGLQGVTAISKGEILGDEIRQTISHHPLVPEKFRKGPYTLSSQEALWAEMKSRKEKEVESLLNLLQRIQWASSFQAFKHLPWDSFRREVEDVLGQWEEVKVSFPPREGLERFLSAAAKEPFLPDKLHRIEEVRAFFDHAERLVFVYQYLSDPRLSLPDLPVHRLLRNERNEIIRFFEAGNISIEHDAIQKVLDRFQQFRGKYIQVYAEAHRRARSGEQFVPYEKIRRSRRYLLLARLDQLEMISVHHNRSLVDRALTAVLFSECNAPCAELLQSNPVCSCGFLLTMEPKFPPIREIEEAIDLGIRETIEALNSPTYQEKLLPYLKGLEEVGENEKASAVRRVLSLSAEEGEGFLSKLDEALTPSAIQAINEAFKGRVVVVRRDLDQLYGALIRRKYSLPQIRKIFREWLKDDEISEGTFVHFIGKGETGEAQEKERLSPFIQAESPHLLPLLQEEGQAIFKKALLLSLWIEAHEISPSQLVPVFPFLQKGKEGRGDLLVQQLSGAARLLRQKEPDLFERVVQEIEEAGGIYPEVIRLFEGEKAGDIFCRETIFPSVLRETFERLLAAPEEEKEGGMVIPSEDPKLPPRTSGFIKRQTEMVSALKDYETLRQKILGLKRRQSNPPQDFSKWESLYLQHLSPLSFLLATFPYRVERMEISLPLPAKNRLQQAEDLSHHFSEKFSEFYRNALPLWEAGEAKRPKMIEDLERAKIPQGAQKIFILMDGMRWDLWEYLKENFFSSMANQVRIIQEGALWAHLPSTTPRQMEFFAGEEKKLWKIAGIDERVHTERGNLEYLFRNILQFLQLDLAPRLRELPAGIQIILFSDHGFVENPHFEKSDKYRTSRYIHGEASPFEIIVPWASVMKIG
jgi:hypothetical protein